MRTLFVGLTCFPTYDALRTYIQLISAWKGNKIGAKEVEKLKK